jgi:indole-3-glycerol phosphate synthase
MNTSLMKNRYDFFDRLSRSSQLGEVPVIAEIKVYTPNNGDLMQNRTVESVAELYQLSGMACMSVVTGRWFKGSPELLQRARQASELPILRKDFIVTKSTLEYSKELGASAVLLTKQLLDNTRLNKLANYALVLGLTPFIEVSSSEEIDTMRVDQETILAVCNRDIKTHETDDGDITKSLALLASAKSTGAGLVVSASAIEDSRQAKLLLTSGYDGLLIGTAFLKAPDLAVVLSDFYKTLRCLHVNIPHSGSEKTHCLDTSYFVQ